MVEVSQVSQRSNWRQQRAGRCVVVGGCGVRRRGFSTSASRGPTPGVSRASECPKLACLSAQGSPVHLTTAANHPPRRSPTLLSLQRLSIMATIQRLVVSLLVFLSVAFVFFAQSAEAAKSPKITHKVRPCAPGTRADRLTVAPGFLGHEAGR